MSKGEDSKEVTPDVVDLRRKFASLYGTFGTDPVLAKQGIIVEYELAKGKKVEFKIKKAGARNQDWKLLYNQLMKPHAEEIEANSITEEDHGKLLSELYAKSVVLGWNGVEDSEGQAVPFTIQNCMELMQFMPELLSNIIADSHDRSNFRHEEMEATAKNS